VILIASSYPAIGAKFSEKLFLYSCNILSGLAAAKEAKYQTKSDSGIPFSSSFNTQLDSCIDGYILFNNLFNCS